MRERNRFEKIYIKSKTGFRKNSMPNTEKNVRHWLETFGTSDIAEGVEFKNDNIIWFGRLLLKYRYHTNYTEIPYFYNLKYAEFEYILINQKDFFVGLKKFPKLVAEIDEKYTETRKTFGL